MDTRYPFPASPNGWFSVGAVDDLVPGDVRPVHYLGRDLVLFRGDDARARVFDAHCLHLGAHLGVGGRVCGDGIVCPFHGWRYDGEGRLVEVPGLDRTPRVSARLWPVCERNGRIFVWHHAADAPPSFDVIGYRPDEESWTPWRSSTYQVRVHVQDLTENIIDRSHFAAVHDMASPDQDHFEVRFSGASMIVEQSLKVTAASEAGIEVDTTTTTCGPGIAAIEVNQGPLEMLTYIAQTPIDDQFTEVNLLFSMKRLPDEDSTESISEMNDQITNLQFTQDVPIWENKIYRHRPILTKIDGPVAQYRRWFKQFYSD
jgi:phenylpropionate dioxygenase-like ring-hydroxylating dioxygenase large terminal subunit